MARTFRGVMLNPSTPTRHPKPTLPLPPPIFDADLCTVRAEQIDADSVILLPQRFYLCESSFDEWDRWQEDGGKNVCWKTTRCYEQIGEAHERVVEFKRRDPYTAFPILAKPSGPTMVSLLDENGARMYTEPVDAPSSRVRPEYLPVVYQWALDIISGLVFVHSHDVVFGEISVVQCWLDADYRVSLAGFMNAGFLNKERWYTVEGEWDNWYDQWLSQRKPSKETDLMMFGYVLYELMTAYVCRLGMRSWKKVADDVPRHQWPRLETKHMGDIVRKCWNGEYVDAEEVKVDLKRFLVGNRWEIDADDKLKGLDAAVLFYSHAQS